MLQYLRRSAWLGQKINSFNPKFIFFTGIRCNMSDKYYFFILLSIVNYKHCIIGASFCRSYIWIGFLGFIIRFRSLVFEVRAENLPIIQLWCLSRVQNNVIWGWAIAWHFCYIFWKIYCGNDPTGTDVLKQKEKNHVM